MFFSASVKRVGDLATFEQEVAALAHDRRTRTTLTWHPASVDFRAISIRSAPRKPLRADAEINSLDGFFRMLAEPARASTSSAI